MQDGGMERERAVAAAPAAIVIQRNSSEAERNEDTRPEPTATDAGTFKTLPYINRTTEAAQHRVQSVTQPRRVPYAFLYALVFSLFCFSVGGS